MAARLRRAHGRGCGERAAGISRKAWYERAEGKPTTMMDGDFAGLNGLSPADHNATPWAATPDGSWTRMVGAGVNPDIPPPPKEGRFGAMPRPATAPAIGTRFRPSTGRHHGAF
jgi:hypothetical protein